MAGGFLKRQGDVSGDREDATSQASVTIEVPIVSLWSENPVPMFEDPANPTVLRGHIIPPQAEDTQWRAVIDLSLLRPWHGTGSYMCALNVVALALLPGCTGVTSTPPSVLNAAVMRHFSGTTSKPRVDARAAAIKAVMSCGHNYSTPTKEARLSLPTIFECLPANFIVLTPVAVSGPTDDIQFQVVGRGTVTMTELIAQFAIIPCIVWADPIDCHVVSPFVPSKEQRGTLTAALMAMAQKIGEITGSPVKSVTVSLLPPEELPVWQAGTTYGDSSRCETPDNDNIYRDPSLPEQRPFRPAHRTLFRREIRATRAPKKIWVEDPSWSLIAAIAKRKKARSHTKYVIKQMVFSVVVHELIQCIVKAFSCHIKGDGHTPSGGVPPPDAEETAFSWLIIFFPPEKPLSPGNSLNYGGEHTNTGPTITTAGNLDGTQELFLSPPTSMLLPLANGGIPPWAQPLSPLDSDGPTDLISLSNLTGSPSHIGYAVDWLQPDSPELPVVAGNEKPGALAPTPSSTAPESQQEGREREGTTSWEVPYPPLVSEIPAAAQWLYHGSAGLTAPTVVDEPSYLLNDWDERSTVADPRPEEDTDRDSDRASSPASSTLSDTSVLSEYAEVARPFYTEGQHIGVSSCNVNGPEFADLWIQELYARLGRSSIDVIFLLYTLVRADAKNLIHIFLSRSAGGSGRNDSIGGVTLLVRKRDHLGWTVSKLLPDPSGCGIFLGANVHRSDGCRIRVIGAYLPAAISDKLFGSTLGTIEQESDTEERPFYALATKVRHYLFSVVNLRRFPTANSWFWYRMSKMVQDSEWECILAGDFNRERSRADSTSLPSDFQKAAGNIGLSNPTADALRALGDPYCTLIYEGQFCKGIDHVLGTLPPDVLRAVGVLVDPVWVAGSDHAPIWAGYKIPRRDPPIKPEWKRVDRRLNVHVRKNKPVGGDS
jgi:hypothetical protein